MSAGKVNLPSFDIYVKSVDDLDDCLYAGIYMYNQNTLNTPGTIDAGNAYGFCTVYSTNLPESTGAGWIIQEAHCTSGIIYIRKRINYGNSWSNWRLTGGTEDSSTRITSTQGTVYARIIGGAVNLSMSGIKPVSGTWTTIVNVGGLPVKYRPTYNVTTFGHSNAYGKIPMSVLVSNQGNIQVSVETTPSSADGNVNFIYSIG